MTKLTQHVNDSLITELKKKVVDILYDYAKDVKFNDEDDCDGTADQILSIVLQKMAERVEEMFTDLEDKDGEFYVGYSQAKYEILSDLLHKEEVEEV